MPTASDNPSPSRQTPAPGTDVEPEVTDWKRVVDEETTPRRNPSATGTSWTLISDAIDTQSPTSSESRDQLMKRYWSAVFAFIRSSGRSPQLAEDLTQGFFCDVVLGRNLFDRAEESKGRFRSLLLSAVRNYLADDYRMRTAQRRSPGEGALGRLDDDENGFEPAAKDSNPENAFNSRWVDELIERTTEQTRIELVANDQAMHWDIFKHRVLDPCLTGGKPVPHDDLARKWGLSGLPQVSNLLVTAKRRFARNLLENVRETIPSGLSATSELSELFRALGKNK